MAGRRAQAHLRHLFPYLPHPPAYNKRLRALVDTMAWLISALAADTTIAGEDLWVVDSTPVACTRSRETVRRSALTGAEGPVLLLRLPLPLPLGAAPAPGRRTAGNGARFFKPLRQVIESVDSTLKAQLGLERHGGRAVAGVCARAAQRLLALTTAIRGNDHLGRTIRRSLIAYDH